jgi:Inner membrane component domain
MSPGGRAGAGMGANESASGRGGSVVRANLNAIWLVLGRLWIAICYAVAGLLCFVLIITITRAG